MLVSHKSAATEIKTLRQWLEPEDPVLTHVTKFTAQFAQEREESTCLWLNPYITRFLKSDRKTLAITGKPGSGKSILATVINDQLQHPIGGVSYMPLFVPISESSSPSL
jgi:DNA replication protein DnaC